MKYNIGDKVRINSLDWYNENKDEFGNIDINEDFTFYADRSKYCGKVFTISEVFDNSYLVKEDNHEYYWSDEMIEGLVKDKNNNLIENVVDTVRESNDRYRIVLDPRFDIEVDEGEYYAVRRKKEYPKTYEECCSILNLNTDCGVRGYKVGLLSALQMLLICRDAYWKIAGEEMGLGKLWEPAWNSFSDSIYLTITKCNSRIIKTSICTHDCILTFPTEEMRDAFYENFKELIEQCKELL